MRPSIQIVIVNWRTGNHLRDCLATIEKSDWSNLVLAELTIVDNDSSDGSLEGIRETELPVRVISNSENLGFSRACNQGAVTTDSDYLLFLNPDTMLLPTTLPRAIESLEMVFPDGRGILGVQLQDSAGITSVSCSRFPTLGLITAKALGLNAILPRVFRSHLMSEWDHGESRFVDCVMGAFLLCRRDVYAELGGFDERYFVYYEEVDFTYRASLVGIPTYFDANTQAIHCGHGSTGSIKDTRLFYSWRSRLQYSRRHFGRIEAGLVALLTYTLEPMVRMIASLLRGAGNDAWNTWRAYGKLMKDKGQSPGKGHD